jgi:D-glycero-D-manno-heptose 1,7-bisphosphate phosphatase
MHPALFLDRDGVIIENCPDYVRHWEDVHFIPQALEALGSIRLSPYKIVIVTNQSAVGRGLIPLDIALQINQRIIETVERHGGRIDGSFICPHAPQDNCDAANTGLAFFTAAQALSWIWRSYLIGDALSDLLLASCWLVPTIPAYRGVAEQEAWRDQKSEAILNVRFAADALEALLRQLI